ncbi:group III truncated hemoglobin [Parasphingorhabdus cellanae]|uniref:Group III truncated hemoglobin n=1 Tax=Parasphingorhabdus cellanae TaxID=2806553 RepID=A0ABX7T091_9SPHN|nr:group III truncated hemoglobin [Parasphingorhabdus cellanae]QTD54566.1 group III truncated hemoglobin [Parasphingorhabdus cellanae]
MVHPHTMAAREDKAAHAAALGITEVRISELVERFYEKIRGDALLGPIFDEKVTNWPPHLARMKDFWTSIAIESGRFRGNPMIKHLAISDIKRIHFDRWLALFDETLQEVMPNAGACRFLSERAARIADSLMTGISIHRDGLPEIAQKRGD